MPETVVGISTGAVEDATGHGWDHWLAALDERDGEECTHKELVAALDDLGVESGWWRQTVANGYEVERGMREVGETADAGYQVGVQRTVYAEQGAVWEHLLSAAGLGTWLGDTDDFEAEPGRDYETGDGTVGEVRTVREGERLRMTWQPGGRDEPTTLQLTLSCPRNDEAKTTLRVHHEKLDSASEREAMREHWRETLDRIVASLGVIE